MEEKIYLALLHKIGFDQKDLHKIFCKDRNYKQFYDTMSVGFIQSLGFKKEKTKKIRENKLKVGRSSIEKQIEKEEIKIIIFGESNYPEELNHISTPPYIIYLKGQLGSEKKFSVVGSRNISDYGKKCSERIIPEISKYFTIISGGAFGCDTQAHIDCMRSGGKTIAILGTGIDICYPIANKKLFRKILETGGGVLSIFRLGMPGDRYTFPIRNEIIAGLSVGTLIIEGKKKSGTMITAKLSLDLGKDLFTIPGNIFLENYSCNNSLIVNGEAKPIIDSNGILEEYNIYPSEKIQKEIPIFDSDVEGIIYSSLIGEPKTIENIQKIHGIDIQTCTCYLSILELKTYIKKNSKGKYEII